MNRSLTILLRIAVLLLSLVICVLCFSKAAESLISFVTVANTSKASAQTNATNYSITERYNMFITNTLSDVLEGVLSIPKVYWLSDDDLVAPEPNQAFFGATDDPTTLQWLLDDAAGLLDGQDTLFSTDVDIFRGSQVQYYLDETILTITWKQVMDNAVYTISEVKIADPSQFRRFLAGGEYASSSKYTPSEMATSVNAVVASNGDFYTFRDCGIIVYDSQLMRLEGWTLDTCFIAGNGDLILVNRGEMWKKEAVESFLEENQVRFSLSFGPNLVQNGKLCNIKHPYAVGEGDIAYARLALCQRDTLHYLLVSVSAEPPYDYAHTLTTFAKNVHSLGVQTAYNLDGGQSATIVMNDKTVNYVWQRLVSDIIYFATAIPSGD